MLKRKLLATCLFIYLIIPFTYAQGINIDTAVLKRQATEMSSSFMQGDYKQFIKFTYPKVVGMMGGESKMLGILEKGMEQMKNEGVSFKSVTVGLTNLSV